MEDLRWKMKQIAIITLHSIEPNYGNCLQNYAVQTVFNSLGFDTSTELYRNKYFYKKDIFKILILKLSFGLVPRSNERYNSYCKKLSFQKFYDKYIKSITHRKATDISDKYDFFSVGSDQVWNYEWYKGDDCSRFLLSFIDSPNKISFSPSFGVESIDDNWRKVYATELSKFKAISVREKAGAEIIKQLTGRDATVIVDPTMLLTKDDWNKISKKPKEAVENGYVLTYFLSPMSSEAQERLEDVSKGFKVYKLNDCADTIVGKSGPSEFIWLFEHANLILTDSFHACVFSFLFGKPFIVFDRNCNGLNMNSRIETLLHTFHLERKYANSGLGNDIWEHDYSEGYKQLEIEREKAIKYLKEALGVD